MMFKKYRDSSCIRQDRNDNEWNINFLQNSALAIQHKYSSEFSIGWSNSETFIVIRCEAVPSYFF